MNVLIVVQMVTGIAWRWRRPPRMAFMDGTTAIRRNLLLTGPLKGIAGLIMFDGAAYFLRMLPVEPSMGAGSSTRLAVLCFGSGGVLIGIDFILTILAPRWLWPEWLVKEPGWPERHSLPRTRIDGTFLVLGLVAVALGILAIAAASGPWLDSLGH